MDTRSSQNSTDHSETGGQEDLRDSMNAWFESPLGKRLLAIESRMLEDVLSRRFGYHLLELGCADFNMYNSSPIGHKFSFSPTPGGTSHEAAARAEAIPLASETIDLVLLHHALDFSDNPHQLLREAARILIAGGDIVTVGFNPFSIWGLRAKLQRQDTVPWRAGMLSPIRLTDWLKLLEFKVEHVNYGVYSLPFNSPRLIRYSSTMDNLAMRLNWPTGGIYVITARKQVAPLTPVQEHWRRIPAPVGIPAAENVARISPAQYKDRAWGDK